MAKITRQSRRADDEAYAIARHIRGSERKLNLVAQLIRGKSASRALIDLEFSRRRMSVEVKKVLESAIANAENNHNLDVDKLYVKEATVGRTVTMKRFRARARGRAASIQKPFSNITIVVKERSAEEAAKPSKKEAKATKAAAKTTAEKPVAKKETAAKKEVKKATKTKTEAGDK